MSLTVRPVVGRRAKISALGTYVPPDVLTNQDLEKMVETNDQWIMERTGIRERHVLAKGLGVSDICTEAAKKCLAARGIGPERDRGDHRGHGDAGHDVSLDGLPGAGQDRGQGRVGIRCLRRLFGFCVCAAGGREDGGERRVQARFWSAARTPIRA